MSDGAVLAWKKSLAASIDASIQKEKEGKTQAAGEEKVSKATGKEQAAGKEKISKATGSEQAAPPEPAKAEGTEKKVDINQYFFIPKGSTSKGSERFKDAIRAIAATHYQYHGGTAAPDAEVLGKCVDYFENYYDSNYEPKSTTRFKFSKKIYNYVRHTIDAIEKGNKLVCGQLMADVRECGTGDLVVVVPALG